MIKVRFLKADGSLDHEVEAPGGTNLLDLAQAEGQPLEGACEGQMACSTCHVVVAKEDFGRLPPASEEEDDLLDLAWAVGTAWTKPSATPRRALATLAAYQSGAWANRPIHCLASASFLSRMPLAR